MRYALLLLALLSVLFGSYTPVARNAAGPEVRQYDGPNPFPPIKK